MSCFSAADLKQRIIIERKTLQGKDELGGDIYAWVPQTSKSIPAEFKRYGARETFVAMRTAPTATSLATIRYRDDGEGNPYYLASDRVIYRGRVYNIFGIIEKAEKRQWLELYLLEATKP